MDVNAGPAMVLAIGLWCATAALAQVARLETRLEPRAGFQPGRPQVGRCSAVVIAPGRAVTSAHAVRHHELRLEEIRVGGVRAEVLLVSADLALLSWKPDATPATDAPLPPVVAREIPPDGAPLVHRWYDHRSGTFRRRAVTWRRWSSIREGFGPGMSGSGVFTQDGALVGIGELAGGAVSGPLDLSDLLRRALAGGLVARAGPP